MIVQYTEAGWEVITQRAHGLVAAQLAFQWQFSKLPDRWMETILAIAEHDDAEMELDGECLLTGTGGPLNYSMKTFERAHCEKLFQLALTKSRYIALLTSMHMDFLYHKEEKDNKQVHTFLKEQRRLQALWRKDLKIDKKTAQELYALLQWCDACSLLICQQQLPPEQRAMEISVGPDKIHYDLVQLTESELTVKPWPFQTESFDLCVESRLISQLKFSSSASFRKAFEAAPINQITWKLKKIPAV